MKYIILFVGLISFNFNVSAQRAKSKNITFRSKLPFGTNASDLSNIGGYKDAQGNEYALVGWEQGLKIVDVTNPDAIVQKINIAGVQSVWREVKTRGDYAYVTTEGGNGLQIIDLTALPNENAIQVKQWQPVYLGKTLSTIHALHIDRNFLYLYGTNVGNKGALVCDITDPWNPSILGAYDDYYVHDGFVLNDTLYACHIYDGFFTAVDMTNKAAPQVLAQQDTPNKFSHNSWLTDDHKTLLTTDEVDGSYVTAYDISDLNNITEIDRIQSQNPGSNSIGHNVHILNDYAITSWYKDGVVIIDAHRPQNLVVVGWYDTSPLSGGDFDGDWGVYPFLPSQNLVVSDISQGLYVLTPTYKRACYLEGTVIDSSCMSPVIGVKIRALGADTIIELTNINGEFKTGTPDPGLYTIEVSKQGYPTKYYTVNLQPGSVFNLNISLTSPSAFNLLGNVNGSGMPLPNANVLLTNNSNTFSFITDNNGNFEKCGVVSDTYTLIAGEWGYFTDCHLEQISSSSPNVSQNLNKGYYDDFSFDFGWQKNATSPTGHWEIGSPLGTALQGFSYANPNADVNNDCYSKAYVTGNVGTTAGDDDIDDGYVELFSPVMNLSSYNDPFINYYRWFVNGGGSSAANDTLTIKVTDGIVTKVVEKITRSSSGAGSWVAHSFRVKDYFTNLSNIQFLIHAEDYAPGHVLECGLDKFEVSDNFSTVTLSNIEQESLSILVQPNPINDVINVAIKGFDDKAELQVLDVTGKTMIKSKLTNEFVSLNSDLPPGIYFVKVYDSKNQRIQKIIKK